MRRFLAFLALLPLLAMGGGQYTIPWHTGATAATASGGTVTYASNGCTNSYANTSVSSLSCTITSVTAGQTIYVSGDWYNAAAPSTVCTDSNGTAYQTIPVTAFTSGSTIWGYGCEIRNAAAGTHVITITYGGQTESYGSMTAAVLNGASPTSPTAAVATPAIGVGNTISTNNVTTSKSNEFILAQCLWSNGGGTLTAGTTPQTMTATAQVVNMGYSGIFTEYGTAATAGSNYAQCTSTAGGYWQGNLIAVH